MMKATREDGKEMMEKLKNEANLIVETGMIPSKGLKGGQSANSEQAKKAVLMLEAFEKILMEKIQQGHVFKKDLVEIEKQLRKAIEAQYIGDTQSAVNAMQKATAHYESYSLIYR